MVLLTLLLMPVSAETKSALVVEGIPADGDPQSLYWDEQHGAVLFVATDKGLYRVRINDGSRAKLVPGVPPTIQKIVVTAVKGAVLIGGRCPGPC